MVTTMFVVPHILNIKAQVFPVVERRSMGGGDGVVEEEVDGEGVMEGAWEGIRTIVADFKIRAPSDALGTVKSEVRNFIELKSRWTSS